MRNDERIIKDFSNYITITRSFYHGGIQLLLRDTLNLILHQKREIGKLRFKSVQMEELIKITKSEAVKEFAERLKAEVSHIPAWGSVAEKKIDNLVKEMTEQSTGYGSSKTEGNG